MYRRFSGIALSLARDGMLVQKPQCSVVFPPTPGKVFPCHPWRLTSESRGAVGTHPRVSQQNSKLAASEGKTPVQILLESQSMLSSDSPSERRVESDNVGFTLVSPQTDMQHKNE